MAIAEAEENLDVFDPTRSSDVRGFDCPVAFRGSVFGEVGERVETLP